MMDYTINSLIPLPTNPDHLVVSVKGTQVFIVHATGGQLIKELSVGRDNHGDIISTAISPQGTLVL
jgi:hypothetical protein